MKTFRRNNQANKGNLVPDIVTTTINCLIVSQQSTVERVERQNVTNFWKMPETMQIVLNTMLCTELGGVFGPIQAISDFIYLISAVISVSDPSPIQTFVLQLDKIK